MNQFLKPKQLDDAQREVVADALLRLDVGDAEGRRIFVYALDYELTEYANFLNKMPLAEKKLTPEIPRALEDLHGLLGRILEKFDQLPDDNRTQLFERLQAHDDYRRQYGEEYLDALLSELKRVGAVCEDLMRASSVKPSASHERPEGQFVRMLANAYLECFEESPQPTESGSFARLLDIIGEQIGMDLNFDEDALSILVSS